MLAPSPRAEKYLKWCTVFKAKKNPKALRPGMHRTDHFMQICQLSQKSNSVKQMDYYAFLSQSFAYWAFRQEICVYNDISFYNPGVLLSSTLKPHLPPQCPFSFIEKPWPHCLKKINEVKANYNYFCHIEKDQKAISFPVLFSQVISYMKKSFVWPLYEVQRLKPSPFIHIAFHLIKKLIFSPL